MTMKAFAYTKYGNQSSILDINIPEVSQDSVLIKISACSFNPIDYKRRDGALKALFPEKIWPVVLGYDGAGVIERVGKGVTKFKEGDEVYTRIGTNYPNYGTAAEFTVVHVDFVALKPKSASMSEAAAIPLAGVTALQMLRRSNFKAGDSVFITGGAGGVGHYAIQLAKILGASRIVATASSTKLPLLTELGATETTDYKTRNYVEEFSSSRPFDIGLDTIGESMNLLKIVKPGGFVISVVDGLTGDSFTSAGLPEIGIFLRGVLWYLLGSNKYWNFAKKQKVNFNSIFLKPNSEDLDTLTQYVDEKKLKSIITVYEGIQKAPEAMAFLETGRATGKVVVTL